MPTTNKRLDELELAIQPGGQVRIAWDCEDPTRPGWYTFEGEELPLDAINERLTAADTLILVDYVPLSEILDNGGLDDE